MVGEKGLEPSQFTLLVPKTNASTNSATRPRIKRFYILLNEFVQLEYLCNYVYNYKKMTVSPCISICKMDPITGYCYGCGRSTEEKIKWKAESTSDEWKKENIEIIVTRLDGWQLKSFKESYEYKIKNGISIFKEKNKK